MLVAFVVLLLVVEIGCDLTIALEFVEIALEFVEIALEFVETALEFVEIALELAEEEAAPDPNWTDSAVHSPTDCPIALHSAPNESSQATTP